MTRQNELQQVLKKTNQISLQASNAKKNITKPIFFFSTKYLLVYIEFV